MTKLDEICNDLLKKVAAARSVVIINLQSGGLMAAAYSGSHFGQEYLDTLVSATVEMFRGQTAQTAEAQLSAQRGREAKNIIHELQVATGDTCYFMAIIPDKPDVALVLVTGKKANLGVGWAAVQNMLPLVTSYCP